MTNFDVGLDVDYKVKPGRGRPATGKIIKNLGVFWLIANGDRQERVAKAKVLREHKYKYVHKAKDLVNAEV